LPRGTADHPQSSFGAVGVYQLIRISPRATRRRQGVRIVLAPGPPIRIDSPPPSAASPRGLPRAIDDTWEMGGELIGAIVTRCPIGLFHCCSIAGAQPQPCDLPDLGRDRNAVLHRVFPLARK